MCMCGGVLKHIMLKRGRILTILLLLLVLIVLIVELVGYVMLYNKGESIKDLLSISYAPVDKDSFFKAAEDSLKYINEEDVEDLFTLDGGELTEYDLQRSVSINMDIAWGSLGLKPRLVYDILVTTTGGVVELIMHMDLGVLGLGKVRHTIVYDITR